jgi:ABC-type transport system substrate-binding protein
VLAILVIAALAFTACTTPVPVPTEGAAPAAEGEAVAGAVEDLSRPHPQLSVPEVRKAIAHCIDRDALIASVYPYVEDDVKPTLRMDVGVPKDHWTWQGPYTDYVYDPALANQLLDEAGFVDDDGDGTRFTLSLTTTNAQFRATWSAVVEQNLADCGIVLIRQLTPASWWFGDTTGLARRDFELGAFAWVGQVSPPAELYRCDLIPTPGNNWEGQNGMGWCNETASNAAVLANNSLDQEVRMEAFNTLWTEFANDMVSLPLFQRAEAEAWSLNLDGVRTSGTEYATASAADWSLVDGGDTLVVGFSQEPASMFDLVESAAVQRQASQLGRALYNTQWDYDYQPVLQDGFSRIEDGLASNDMVDVVAGDIVWNSEGRPEPLAEGVEVLVDGVPMVWDGTSALQLPQLTVSYKFLPHTWSDGVAASNADFALAFKINCDPESGATTFITCDSISGGVDAIEYTDDGSIGYTIKYVPGVQDPYYYLAPFTISPASASYPAHQVLADGRSLADVPAAEWTTLPEIAEKPLSIAPWYISEWVKGQSMTFEVNPYYYGEAPAIQRVVIVFVPDTTQLVAQLISGDVDYVEKSTLGGGAEVQLVKDAGDAGTLNFHIIPSPTWEHIDMNLYIKER